MQNANAETSLVRLCGIVIKEYVRCLLGSVLPNGNTLPLCMFFSQPHGNATLTTL